MTQGVFDTVKRGLAIGFGPLIRAARPTAPPPRRAKQRRSALVLMVPAVLWVFIQLVMSGFIMQPTQALAGGLHTITICSGTELTTITLDADGQPVKNAPAKKVSCPWCAQFAGIGELPAPAPAPVAAPCGEGQIITMAQGRLHRARAASFHYIARAPPFLTSL